MVLNFLLVETPPIRIISIIIMGIVITPAIYHWLISDLVSLLFSSTEKISAYMNADVISAIQMTLVCSRLPPLDVFSICVPATYNQSALKIRASMNRNNHPRKPYIIGQVVRRVGQPATNFPHYHTINTSILYFSMRRKKHLYAMELTLSEKFDV